DPLNGQGYRLRDVSTGRSGRRALPLTGIDDILGDLAEGHLHVEAAEDSADRCWTLQGRRRRITGLTPHLANRQLLVSRGGGGPSVQDVVLALLGKGPSHGYDLRGRLLAALGPLGGTLNAGQVYVTLTRLEKAGLVVREREDASARGPRRKVYALTAAGRERVAGWLAEPAEARADVAGFHLK